MLLVLKDTSENTKATLAEVILLSRLRSLNIFTIIIQYTFFTAHFRNVITCCGHILLYFNVL